MDDLGHQELVVVPQRRDKLTLWPEHASLDRVEGVQHLKDSPVLLPDRVADALQRRVSMLQLPPRLLEGLPGRVAARPRFPRAGVALDPLERVLGIAPTLPLDERAEIELAETREQRAALAGERLAKVASPPTMMGSEVPDG